MSFCEGSGNRFVFRHGTVALMVSAYCRKRSFLHCMWKQELFKSREHVTSEHVHILLEHKYPHGGWTRGRGSTSIVFPTPMHVTTVDREIFSVKNFHRLHWRRKWENTRKLFYAYNTHSIFRHAMKIKQIFFPRKKYLRKFPDLRYYPTFLHFLQYTLALSAFSNHY